jgi:hypothetical protein
MPSPLNTVDIYVETVAATKVRFSIPVPSFGGIVNESYAFPHVGNAVSGVELDLGGCQPSGTIYLGSLTVVLPSGTVGGCVPWQINPDCEIDDCDGVTRPASPRNHEFADAAGCCGYIDCPSLPPSDLFPADGATSVALNVALSWTAPPLFTDVRISTDPACYTGQEFFLTGTTTFSPNFLQPNTTYYWQVGWGDGLECGGASAVHSFTTEGPVPADQQTWGRIKALYQ